MPYYNDKCKATCGPLPEIEFKVKIIIAISLPVVA
jgi:hypothetical protein